MRVDGVIAWLGGRSAAAVTFGAMVSASLLYRIALLSRLITEEITPFSFVPSPQAMVSLSQHLAVDALFAGACAAVVALAGRWVALLILVLAGLAAGAHFDLVFALHEGLSWEASTEGLGGNFGLLDIRSYATPAAILLGLAPLAVAATLRWHPPRWSGWRARALAAAVALMLVAGLPARFPDTLGLKGWQPKAPLRRLPLVYWLADTAAHFTRSRSPLELRAAALPPVTAEGVRIVDPEFGVRAAEPSGAPRPPVTGEFNVLMLVLESVSAARAFDEGPGGAWPIPMPFLHARAQEGLWLTDHRSTSNSSARSIFSILSGLYPRPSRQMYCTRPGLTWPSLATWLQPDDAFLVTPSRLQSYFPRSWLAASGLVEQHGFDELPPSAEGRPQWPSGRNELDAVDFFIARLARAQGSFLAVYYSYAPHYDYFDYGPAWQIAPAADSPSALPAPAGEAPPLHRYINNLRLLDTQIERIFRQLEADGRLARTLLLLVGDHGEAFGEHDGNWTHSRHSYEENLRTPAILWQPALIPPQRITAPTSHVDLAPTVMSALGRPLPPSATQGEDLLAGPGPLARTYTFSYGNEGTLTAVRRDRRKVQWRRSGNPPDQECRIFDLSGDPAEQSATSCPPDDPQADAILRFFGFQRALLR